MPVEQRRNSQKSEWNRELGARLRSARTAMGISQDELSRRVPCARHLVTVWESGQYAPSAIMLAQLARALGQTSDYLLGLKPARGPRMPRRGDRKPPSEMTVEELRKTYKSRLRIARAATRHTIYSLSVATGLNEAKIARQHRGEYLPRADLLRTLCRELEVSADYLLGMDE